jgi:hypothetical protein
VPNIISLLVVVSSSIKLFIESIQRSPPAASMNHSRNVLFLSMVLLLSVTQASSSSIWSETEKDPYELAGPRQYYTIRSRASSTNAAAGATSNNAANTSFKRSSSDIIADDKEVRRELKAGKKGKKTAAGLTSSPLPLSPLPSSAPSSSPRPSSSPPPCCPASAFSDATSLNVYCPGCSTKPMIASEFEQLRAAPPDPFCIALGFKALDSTTTIEFPSEEARRFISHRKDLATAEGVTANAQAGFDEAMLDFCVHRCGQEYWDGLASEGGDIDITDTDAVNAVILTTCLASVPLVAGDKSCDGSDACTDASFTTIGDTACIGEKSCKGSEYSTIGKDACTSDLACGTMDNSNVGDASCKLPNACQKSSGSTFGSRSCIGNYACYDVNFAKVGSDSCITKSASEYGRACSYSDYATIGNGSCLGTYACFESLGTSTLSLTVGTGSCLGQNACKQAGSGVVIGDGSCTKGSSCDWITVNVGHGSCTYASSCSCPDIATNFSGGIPDNRCNTAQGDDPLCC